MDDFCVYVVKLKKTVLKSPRFMRDNPGYVPGRPCVYVGSTGTTPEDRLEVHRKGGMYGSRWVKKYGKNLFRWAYEALPKFEFEDDARRAEALHAAELRSRGWGVWQR